MRWALLVLVIGVAALAYFFGLRLGYLSLTPTWMYNAQGMNTYAYRTYGDGTRVRLVGTCDTRAGKATFRLFDPNGQFVAGQTCTPGKYGINLGGENAIGFYRLTVEFDHFTGRLQIDEQR